MSTQHELVLAVVPTIIIPFAAVTFALNALATTIAAWFGLELKWEGPKRLLEVFTRPRVLVAGVILNLVLVGAFYGVRYFMRMPSSLAWIQYRNPGVGLTQLSEANEEYPPWVQRLNQFDASIINAAPAEKMEIRQSWRTKLPKGIFGGVTLSGESAFVGSDDGYVYELVRRSGKILRRFYIGTPATSQPLVWKGRLFTGEGLHTTHHCRVYSFDLQTGRLAGSFQTRGHTEGGLVIATFQGITSLFVMAGSDGIYAVDPETMKERWHLVAGHTDSEVRVLEDRLFFSTGVETGFRLQNHFALALDFLTGTILWKTELPNSGWMPPVLYGRQVCFGTGEIDGKASPGQWICLDRNSGLPLNRLEMPGAIMSVPLRTGDVAAIADMKGTVCAISLSNNGKKWCRATRGQSYASLALWQGAYLYPSAEEGLLALSELDGRTLSCWMPTDDQGKWAKSNSRVTVDGDEGYLSDIEGNVRQLKMKRN